MSTTTKTSVNYAHPTATLILPSGASREDWLAVRTQGIGGSDASAVAGVNKWSSPYSVWLDKMGLSEEKEQTTAMLMGNLLEPIIKELFIREKGLTVLQRGLLRSKEHPFMQYTPDGFVEDGGLFEAKSSSGWLSAEWEDGQVPDHAELQVQHGLAVTGRSHAWVCGLLDGREFMVRRVDRDEELIGYLIEIERRFWNDHVAAGVAPGAASNDIDLLKDRFSISKHESTVIHPAQQLAALRGVYDNAAVEVKKWTEEKDAAAAKLRQIAGEHELIVGDDQKTYATLKANGLFSESRFTKDHPTLARQYEIQVPKLDKKKIEAEQPELYRQYRARTLRAPKLK